jgi:hypothetical protein
MLSEQSSGSDAAMSRQPAAKRKLAISAHGGESLYFRHRQAV